MVVPGDPYACSFGCACSDPGVFFGRRCAVGHANQQGNFRTLGFFFPAAPHRVAVAAVGSMETGILLRRLLIHQRRESRAENAYRAKEI